MTSIRVFDVLGKSVISITPKATEATINWVGVLLICRIGLGQHPDSDSADVFTINQSRRGRGRAIGSNLIPGDSWIFYVSSSASGNGKDDIAAWFIDTDYDEESFFVRHAYFMGANDPYKSLKTSLKAEIDKEAWETLYRDKSHPFARPPSGRFAVKVINHFGDEVMKVFGV